jgi:hypothetical protein
MRRLGAEDRDAAGARRCEPHEAAQRRCLAGAVPAEQRGDLAFGYLQADVLQDVALAVKGVQPFGSECRRAHAALPR